MAETNADEWTRGTPKQGVEASTGAYAAIEGVSDLDGYDIMNGDVTTIKPYLQRATVPDCYKWVKVGGVTPITAMKNMDAFIKSHIYQVRTNPPKDSTPATMRRDGFLLGVARAVMVANYRLKESDLMNGEVVGPWLNVVPGTTENPGTTHEVLVASTPRPAATTEAGTSVSTYVDHRTILTEALVLEEAEKQVMKHVVRSAQGIIPLQGFGLLTEGHHYLSGTDKSSFKAFQTVEKQVWVGPEANSYLKTDLGAVRDILWHKAGHPVSVVLKMRAATTMKVKTNLVAAGLGSSASRIPCLEAELRPLDTYAKLAESARATIEMYMGVVDHRVFNDVKAAIEQFPIGHGDIRNADGTAKTITIGPYVTDGPTITFSSREEIVVYSRGLIERSRENIAICYGYHCKMTEEGALSATGGGAESLKRAYSLKKLKDECPASYMVGYEMAGDYKAYRAKKRADGVYEAPNIVFF